MTDPATGAEVERLVAENGHLRRALEFGNDTYVLAMAADRDRWQRRAERWKAACRIYRRCFKQFAGAEGFRWIIKRLPKPVPTHQEPGGA